MSLKNNLANTVKLCQPTRVLTLEISLSSLGLKQDDEVIVPVQTFIATGSSVLKSGANSIL